MTELEFLQGFIDWAQAQGKLTHKDMTAYTAQLQQQQQLEQARAVVAEQFKGRF